MLGVFREDGRLGKRLIIIFKGLPCSWNRCTFCPFFIEQGSLEEVIRINNEILNKAKKVLWKENIERISVFNGGSFYELPLNVVLKLSEITENKIVDIETRPEFISKEVLLKTKQILNAKELVVRVGFENFNEKIRNIVLNKGISQEEITRLSKLRENFKRENIPIKLIAYVLFGIEGVPEETIVESVEKFNKLFDGVIAIKYRRYLKHHPKEIPISENLVNFLKRNTLLIDWSTSEINVVGKVKT